ncbi:sirohydrochlorin chelatase [Allochromatium palmeri]|uniref:Cobalamin biosynthesis protein CbiX n=1 Tax=Allochromatium palmeri TaxID=231048 RepID=A0A6N8E9D2_9GAMM|nr:CbiX/SirB N-terminal domain-containing protein [Allochromatium palmeri]MTW20745.1 cobalamin biosynthesis protein CbiX [Allochromatium palmeri]
MRSILLVDNGSSRPDSTLNLRRIAARLAERVGEPIRPVSLLHADRVAPEHLAGQPAEILAPTLRHLVSAGERELVILPLFFGPSRALTQFVPELAAEVAAELGHFQLETTPELCPLPAGEPRLIEILADNLTAAATKAAITPKRVVLVDHGSPIPEVTAVRRWLAGGLAERLGAAVRLEEAVMERRPGPDYDFNGPLLEDSLTRLAEEDGTTPILLSMLFLSAGRHAGAGGDIARICAGVAARFPRLRIAVAPLVGEHPGLIGILASRL